MKNRRNGAITAAIACMLSAPLAIGPYAAQADELSDLRVNQDLLQRRLDQLAQAPISPVGGLYPGGAPAASAGTGTVGGSFPRSFLIPGSDTSLRVGGRIITNVTYVFSGGRNFYGESNAGNNGMLNGAPLNVHIAGFNAQSLARARGTSRTYITPAQSTFNIETRTPTAWGEARTFMEADWSLNNQYSPGNNAGLSTNNAGTRLRFAYATLGGLLGGQANSNFADPDAGPESISFGGVPGQPGVTRIPQLRYTQPLAGWGIPGALSVSAESPETDGWTNAGISVGSAVSQNPTFVLVSPGAATLPFKNPAPDLTMAWYIPQPWGHMDFGALLRPTLQIKDGMFVDRTYTGYGFSFAGDVKPRWFGWDRDYIAFSFTYGDGIGRYVAGNSSEFSLISNYPTSGALLTSPAAAANIIVKPTVSWSGVASYQHRWTPTLRSNANFGILHHDISNVGNAAAGFVCAGARTGAAKATGAGGCGLNKELLSTQLNLIWNPVPFADIGIEYTWGHRVVLSNVKGDVNAIVSRFRVNF